MPFIYANETLREGYRVCRDVYLNFTSTLQIDATSSTSKGHMYFPKRLTPIADGTYEASGVVSHDASSVRVTAALPPLSSARTSAFSVVQPTAAHIQAMVQSTVTYEDAQTVGVHFQVRSDEAWSTSTAQRNVVVTATPNNVLSAQSSTAVSTVVSCPNLANGMCQTTLALRSAWFAPREAAGGEVSISYGFNGVETQHSLGNVSVQPLVSDSGKQGSLYLDLPKGDLYQNQVIELKLTSLLDTFIDTVELTVDVGTGLEIVSGTSPLSGGKAVFQGAFSINTGTKRSASLSYGRIVSKTAQAQPAPTNEEVVVLRVKVTGTGPNTGASRGINVSVDVDKISDSSDNEVVLSSAPFVRSRDTLGDAGWGMMYVAADTVVGFFGYVSNSEVLNLAVLTGKEQAYSVGATSVSRRGSRATVSSQQLGCVGTASSSVSGVSLDCKVTLSGKETGGSANAMIQVAHKTAGLVREVPMRVLFPYNASLSTERAQIHPIAGWFDEDRDANCSSYMYQTSSAKVVVGYGPSGDNLLATADVTSEMKGSWSSSVEGVAVIDSDGVVVGRNRGTAIIQLAGDLSPSIAVEVTDTPMLVIGLDASVQRQVSVSRATTSVKSHDIVQVTATTEKSDLRYEGDETTVVVSAVFEDHSRVRLSHAMGLRLASNSPTAIVVANQVKQLLRVPESPRGDQGPLVTASWTMNTKCSLPAYVNAVDKFESNISLSVDPPAADALFATPSTIVMVPSQGAAAAAGFTSTQTLSVSLRFPDGRQLPSLQADARVTYTIIAGSAANTSISVSDVGEITPALAKLNLTGTTQVLVSFEGQNVTATVDVEVVNYRALEVFANPYPTYGGSSGVLVTQLSVVEGVIPTKYEQAVVSLRMTLMDGRQTTLTGGASFDVAEEVGNANATLGSRIVTPSGSDGLVVIGGSFAGDMVTANLTLNISTDAVSVVGIESLRLQSSRGNGNSVTMVGAIGRKGQLAFSAKLSNGRYINNAVTTSGQINLPSLFSFESTVLDKLSIGATTGSVELLGNHHRQATLRVKIGNSVVVGGELAVWCNLDTASVGDVDLGQSTLAPIASLAVGESGTFLVRLNTGTETLGAFQILVEYDPSAMEITSSGVKYVVPQSKGTVGAETVVRSEDGVVEMIGVITDSQVRGSAESLAEITFKALNDGVHGVSGTVVTLENNDASPQTFGEEDRAFEAGNVTVEISKTRRRRTEEVVDESQVIAVVAEDSLVASTRAVVLDGARSQSRARRADCEQVVGGDVNCDCSFKAGDALYVHNYIAAKAQSFQVKNGDVFTDTLTKCPHTLHALDADSSGEVRGVDAQFLLKVLAGKRFFVELTLRSTNTTSTCATDIEARVAGGNRAVPVDARVHAVFAHENAALVSRIATSQVLIGQATTSQARLASDGLTEGGLVLLMSRVNGSTDGTVAHYTVRLNTNTDLDGVGVSVASVVEISGTTHASLAAGTQAADARFMAVTVANSEVGSEFSVTSIGARYNPKAVFDRNPATATCKLQEGLCDELPCGGDDVYLKGLCTMETDSVCTNRTVCTPSQYALFTPNGTQDRVCIESESPTTSPTVSPSVSPTTSPTVSPTLSPTMSPTVTPTQAPTVSVPTVSPTTSPTVSPTVSPTISPSVSPSISPTVSPTFSPTTSPTISPTISPTVSPTVTPTISPTTSPTVSPTVSPSISPTVSPTLSPTVSPTISPTVSPTISPTISPTASPTVSPTISPTISPTVSPTISPTTSPTVSPTISPTTSPTFSPTPCAYGEFLQTGNYCGDGQAQVCTSWREPCSEFEYESTPPGPWFDGECTVLTVCVYGEYEAQPPQVSFFADARLPQYDFDKYTATPPLYNVDRVCKDCSTCGSNEWEVAPCNETHDTICEVCSNCEIDEFVARECVYSDTMCLPIVKDCQANEFLQSEGTCVGIRTCKLGFAETVAPTATSDRICERCPLGYFSDRSTPNMCHRWEDCPPGTFVSRIGTDRNDRKCNPCQTGDLKFSWTSEANSLSCNSHFDKCDEGHYSLRDTPIASELICLAMQTCEAGSFVFQAGSTTSDRKCCQCDPAVQFTSHSNKGACSNFTSCQPGEFEQVAPTATTDRECLPCVEFTFQPSAAAKECYPITTCAFPNYTSVQPTPSSDAVCAEISTCDYSQEFEATPPTGSSDRDCVECRTCAVDEFLAQPCNNISNTVCTICTVCEDNFYETAPCQGINDRTCQALNECVADHQFEEEPASATTDRTCKNITQCMAGEFIHQHFTSTSDRDCQLCPPETYQDQSNQGGCDPASVCDAAFQFESIALQSVADRFCANLTACNATTEYASSIETPTTNRVCSSITACVPVFEYETDSPTPSSDRECDNVTTSCGIGHGESKPPTPTSDRECAPCADGQYQDAPDQVVCNQATTCNDTEFEVKSWTSSSDRLCFGLRTCDNLYEFESFEGNATFDRVCTPIGMCNISETYETTAPSPTSNRICSSLTQCSDHEYITVPPTLTSDLDCGPLRLCDLTTQYYSSHNATTDRVCLNQSLCEVGYGASVQPTETSDRECELCDGEVYYQDERSGEPCKRIKECDSGEYGTVQPTSSSNRQCDRATPCDTSVGDFFIAAQPTSTNDRQCNRSTICSPGEAESVAVTRFSDRECERCDGVDEFQDLAGQLSCKLTQTCDAKTQFRTAHSTPTSDRECAYATVCNTIDATEYTSKLLTPTTDRECLPTTPCKDGFGQVAFPTLTEDRKCEPCDVTSEYVDVDSGGTCQPLAVCDGKTTFESVVPTLSSNRNCAAISDCDIGTFVTANATATSNRDCVVCNGVSEYQNETNQEQCIATTTCRSFKLNATAPHEPTLAQYARVTATPSSDRECADVSPCNYGEFVSRAQTASSDRECEVFESFTKLTIVVSDSVIAHESDVATTLAVTTNAVHIQVLLQTDTQQVLDVSNDERLILRLGADADLGSLQQRDDGVWELLASQAGKVGTLNITATLTHIALVSTVTIQVVTSTIALERADTGREFPFAEAATKELRRWGGAAAVPATYEAAVYAVKVVLSTGESIDVSVGFEEDDVTVTAIGAAVVELDEERGFWVVSPTGVGEISITAMVSGVASSTDVVTVNDTQPIQVEMLTNLRVLGMEQPPVTLTNGEIYQLQVQVTFDNGIQIEKLLDESKSQGNNALFQGLVSLVSIPAGVMSVDSVTGRLTVVRSTSSASILATAASNANITASVQVAIDIDAEVGDIDFTSLQPQSVGETFRVPIYANTGSSVLGAFGVKISFNPNVLSFSKVVETKSDGLTNVVSRLSSAQDSLLVVGADSSSLDGEVPDSPRSGAQVHVVTIEFVATAEGASRIRCTILDLLTLSSTAAPIGGVGGPRKSVAADAMQIVGNMVDLQVDDSYVPADFTIKTTSNSAQRNCEAGLVPIGGDVNEDCVFTLADVNVLANEIASGRRRRDVQKGKRQSSDPFDVDGNTFVNAADVVHAMQGYLGRLSFPQLSTTTNNDMCTMEVSVTLLPGNIVSDSVDTSTTSIFIGLYTDAGGDESTKFQSQFDVAEFTGGNVWLSGSQRGGTIAVTGGVVELGEDLKLVWTNYASERSVSLFMVQEQVSPGNEYANHWYFGSEDVTYPGTIGGLASPTASVIPSSAAYRNATASFASCVLSTLGGSSSTATPTNTTVDPNLVNAGSSDSGDNESVVFISLVIVFAVVMVIVAGLIVVRCVRDKRAPKSTEVLPYQDGQLGTNDGSMDAITTRIVTDENTESLPRFVSGASVVGLLGHYEQFQQQTLRRERIRRSLQVGDNSESYTDPVPLAEHNMFVKGLPSSDVAEFIMSDPSLFGRSVPQQQHQQHHEHDEPNEPYQVETNDPVTFTSEREQPTNQVAEAILREAVSHFSD